MLLLTKHHRLPLISPDSSLDDRTQLPAVQRALDDLSGLLAKLFTNSATMPCSIRVCQPMLVCPTSSCFTHASPLFVQVEDGSVRLS